MSDQQLRGNILKAQVAALLWADDFDERLSEWFQFPLRRVVSPLISFLCSPDERIKWRAVEAMGIVVARMAEIDVESARVIMRRLMWYLNDESGGIGWGAPEAMGEIMASSERLAVEYAHILVTYIREDASKLDYDLLERGVLWGLGRLAMVRPHLLQDAAPYVLPYLESSDPVLRGLSAWVVGLLKAKAASPQLKSLLGDTAQINIFLGGSIKQVEVRDLASEALRFIDR